MTKPRVLLTTSDYLPQLGGLTTYTQNIEICLNNLKIEYDLFHWKSISDLKKFSTTQSYTHLINIHFMGGFYLQHILPACKHINVYHGSELFFTSPNIVKKIIKKIIKSQMIKYIAQVKNNIFISSYTQSIAKKMGLHLSYERDLIFHNCIDVSLASYTKQTIDQKITFCSIVRDTPHKNVIGCIEFCEHLQTITKKKIILSLPFKKYTSNIVEIKVYPQLTDTQREELYRESHFNLLLSLDHSSQGFIEGFGLSCLEAGKYGTPSIVLKTGGLPDNVHSLLNGLVINDTDSNQVSRINHLLEADRYHQLRLDTFNHTIISHALSRYEPLLNRLLK